MEISKDEFLRKLEFPDEWVRLGLYTHEIYSVQLEEYERNQGSEEAPEHYRYGAFWLWFRQNPDASVIERLLAAAIADPDPAMSGATIVDIVKLPHCTELIVEAAISAIQGSRYSSLFSSDDVRAAHAESRK